MGVILKNVIVAVSDHLLYVLAYMFPVGLPDSIRLTNCSLNQFKELGGIMLT